jgi:hypothetical protein
LGEVEKETCRGHVKLISNEAVKRESRVITREMSDKGEGRRMAKGKGSRVSEGRARGEGGVQRLGRRVL